MWRHQCFKTPTPQFYVYVNILCFIWDVRGHPHTHRLCVRAKRPLRCLPDDDWSVNIPTAGHPRFSTIECTKYEFPWSRRPALLAWTRVKRRSVPSAALPARQTALTRLCAVFWLCFLSCPHRPSEVVLPYCLGPESKESRFFPLPCLHDKLYCSTACLVLTPSSPDRTGRARAGGRRRTIDSWLSRGNQHERCQDNKNKK